MGVPSDHQPRLHTQINILTGMGDGTDYSLQVVYCHGGRYRFFIIVLFSRLFLLFLSLSLFPPPIVSFSYRQILLEDRYGFLLFPPFHHSLHLLSLSSCTLGHVCIHHPDKHLFQKAPRQLHQPKQHLQGYLGFSETNRKTCQHQAAIISASL